MESCGDAIPADRHCHGELRRIRRVGHLTLVETEYAPAASVPTHSHPSASFCLVLDGGFVERAGATRRCAGAGSLLFHPPGAPHARRFQDGISRCLIVDVGPQLSATMDGRGLGGSGTTIATERTASWLAMRLYEEFCRADAESSLAIEGLSLAVCAQLTRAGFRSAQDDRAPAWLPAVLDLLDECYLAPVRLAELAARVGVHPGYMSRVFRRRVGVTLRDYVRRRRIDWASDRLITTEFPLSRIAMEAGFTDQAHFARLFKRTTGLTPRAFRVARAPADAHRAVGS